jgi:hypothetical protein
MKKIIIGSFLAFTLQITYAEYNVYVPLEIAQGGSLPNGSINLGGQSNSWVSYTPEYTSWIPSGSLRNCTWLPSTDNYDAGVSFTQSGIGCVQDESRNKQEREIEQGSNAIRNVGSPTVEERSTPLGMQQRTAIGTAAALECEYVVNLTSSESTTTVDSAYVAYFGPNDAPTVVKIYWAGDLVFTGSPAASYVVNGYEYSSGDYQTSHSYTWIDLYDYSKICRKAIAQ